MEEQDAHIREELMQWLAQEQMAPGLVIAWAQGRWSELIAHDDSAVRSFAEGIEAWLNSDYTAAAHSWRMAQALGMHGTVLEDLLDLVEAAASPVVTVYADGAFLNRNQSGGAACVYQRRDHIGVLARHLPGPLPDNHYAEVEALRLALVAPELAHLSLVLFTDSEVVVKALHGHEHPNLPEETLRLIAQVAKLCREREARIQHRRARTGQLLHDQADHMARWVRAYGDLPGIE